MKYAIKPYIAVKNIDYQILATEVMKFTIRELEEIVDTMRRVIAGEVDSSSFSQNVAVVEYDSKKATITHFNDKIGEEQTIEIYTLLIEYLALRRVSKSNFDHPAHKPALLCRI